MEIELLAIARNSIKNGAKGQNFEVPEAIKKRYSEKMGVFTTVRNGGMLRGCIGFVSPLYPLWEAVKESAILSVTDDPRFPPVKGGEVSELSIELTLLGKLEKLDLLPGKSQGHFSLGKEGLYMTDGIRSGLLLPQVATENGLDAEEFIIETAHKAGIDPEQVFSGNVEVYKFSARVISESSSA
jgi:AmmeMemoRadiSam system protein A